MRGTRDVFPWFPTARPNPRATSSRPQWVTKVPVLVMISTHHLQNAYDVGHGQAYCIPAHCPNSLNKIFLFIWVKQLSYWQCVNYPVRIPRRTATRHLLPEDIQHQSGNAKPKAIKQTRKLQYFRLASEALCLCIIFQCAWIHVVLREYFRRTNSIVKSIDCKHVDTHTRAKTSIVSLENCQYTQAEINVQREDESYWRTRPVSQIISDLEAWRSAR